MDPPVSGGKFQSSKFSKKVEDEELEQILNKNTCQAQLEFVNAFVVIQHNVFYK